MKLDRVLVPILVFAVSISAAVAVTMARRSAAPDKSTTPAATTAPAAKVTAVSLERGRTVYKANCAACHGDQGHGDGPAAAAFNPKPRNHADAAAMSQLTDEDIAKVIQFGGALKNMPMMPSNPALKGADLQAVVAFTRSLSQAEPATR
jgi:mono/diheme cytochrome c family protein